MPTTYEPIATTTLGSAQTSVTFSSISGAYTDLVLVINAGNSGGTGYGIALQCNNDTGSNYSFTQLYGTGSAATSTRSTSTTFLAGGFLFYFGSVIFPFPLLGFPIVLTPTPTKLLFASACKNGTDYYGVSIEINSDTSFTIHSNYKLPPFPANTQFTWMAIAKA